MNKSTYKQKGSSVHGNGKRYNLTNVASAIDLCNTLNNLTGTLELYKNTTKQLEKISKQTTQIQMSIKILESEVNKLQEMITDGNNNR